MLLGFFYRKTNKFQLKPIRRIRPFFLTNETVNKRNIKIMVL